MRMTSLLLLISVTVGVHASPKSYTLLMLDFEDRSGINNPLLAKFNDTISYLLSEQTGDVQVRLIPTSDRDALLARAASTQPDATPVEEELLAAEWVDADALVTGSYTKMGEQWSLDAQVYHRREGGKARQPIHIKGDSVYYLLDSFPAQLLKQFDASFVALTTDSWKAYEAFRKGHQEFESYNFSGALTHYEKALELDPTLALAYAQQSYVYSMTGQTERGAQTIEAAKQWLEKASAVEQLAIRIMDYGWDEKKNTYTVQQVLNLAPGGIWDEVLIHRLAADMYWQEGKQAETQQEHQRWFEAIQQQIRAYPENASLLHGTAKRCANIQQYVDEAIDMGLKAIELKLNESREGPRYVLSKLYALQGNIEQVLAWARQSIEKLPNPKEAFASSIHHHVWLHLSALLHQEKIAPERLIRWCEEVVQSSDLHESYRLRTQYLMAEAYSVMNDNTKIEALLSFLGAPPEGDWMVIGPFDAPAENPLPETPPFTQLFTNMAEKHLGVMNKEVQWKPWKDDQPLSEILEVGQVFRAKYRTPGDFSFSIPSVVYSCIYVKVPAAGEADVHTGSALMKVWLNDNPDPVIEVNSVGVAVIPDAEVSRVSLNAGLNRFMVATVYGANTAFSFTFRITDGDGNPIPGLKYISASEVLATR